jgi:class 3 adenylate cyclase
LTVVLGAAFVALTASTQRLIEATTGQRTDVLPVVVGLGVALGFQPLRRRAQAAADRILPAREQRVLFFTDIVGSTERLADLGDARWRAILEQYRSVVRRELRRFGGTEMHIAGDSFFVTFTDPLRAVRCAEALAPALLALGVPSRFGMHWGACEMRGEEVSGLAVWAAARVMSTAGPGEIVVSDAMREPLLDAGLALRDRGTHALKGLPGEWRLHALDAPSSPAPVP